MDVLRVKLTALTASFRYPHFLWGVHPTFDVPPPATLYGLICAAAGTLVPPEGLRVGLHFRHAGKATDYEHVHAIEAGGGQFSLNGEAHPRNLQAVLSPQEREFLLFPELTLYISGADLSGAFRSPVFALSLGRSQDLASVLAAEPVTLRPEPAAYYDGTLLPAGWRTGRGVVLHMPVHIDPERRRASFRSFLFVDRPTAVTGQGGAHWVDPDAPRHLGLGRGVFLHDLAG